MITAGQYLQGAAGICVMACVLVCVSGCARQTAADSGRISRAVARASKAMVQGAEMGGGVLVDTQYREREPNPNAYVGSLLFDRYCEKCHGRGHAPEILEKRVTSRDPESDYDIIRYGLLEMPGFRRHLTSFQILDILAFIKDDLTGFNPNHEMLSYRNIPAVSEKKQDSGKNAASSGQKDEKK